MTIQRPILKHPFSDLARRGQTPPGDLIQDQIVETHRAIDQVIDELADMQAKAAAPPAPTPRALEPESFEHTTAMLSENSAENWAVAAWQWAEYMGGPLPADTVIWMGITGDHWSSRYWANQAAIMLAAAEDWAEQAHMWADAAAVSAADAAASAALADEWGDLYLGSHAVAPTLDNDGDPLQTGALYFDTGFVQMRAWNGTTWQGFETLGDTAADVIFAPTGDITSTTVQNAIMEVYNDSKAYTDSQVGPLITGLANVYTKTETDTRYVNATGDVMSGDLAITKAQPALVLNKAASGEHNLIVGAKGGAWRWLVSVGETTAESGGNAGSDFAIYNYNDAGVFMGAPFSINRATGSASFASIPICYVAPTLGHHLANQSYVETRANEWGAYHAGLRVAKSGDTMTGKLFLNSGYTDSWASPSGSTAIEIADTHTPVLSFHRPGSYAVNLALRALDNGFYLGGWSHGDAFRWKSDTSGNFTATGNVGGYSDERLKTNIRTIEGALDIVCQMRGVWFTKKDSGEASSGVIAQELQKLAPELVRETDGMLAVDYGNALGYLVEAIKELRVLVEAKV